jgi:hypothetical protein
LIVVSHQVSPILEGIPTIIPSLNDTRVPDIFCPREFSFLCICSKKWFAKHIAVSPYQTCRIQHPSYQDTYAQLCEVLKGFGATKIQGAARESIARLWSRYGFKERYIIVEAKI